MNIDVSKHEANLIYLLSSQRAGHLRTKDDDMYLVYESIAAKFDPINWVKKERPVLLDPGEPYYQIYYE